VARPHEAELRKLRPTQLTIGFIEVHHKRKALEALDKQAQRDFLAAHLMPAVRGPGEHVFITDHHHLARAAQEVGIETAFFLIEADLTKLDDAAFWRAMQEKQWAHPIDAQGRRRSCSIIPKHLEELHDDVYRSLAGFVRDRGGYQKTPTAFCEFAWADFFRHRIVIGPTHEDFEHAVDQALVLARSAAARALPGYREAPA
jgi:hypothetical protein